MRVLAGVSACLLFFLLFELYRSPRILSGPEEKVPEMMSDPNLEGTSHEKPIHLTLIVP